MIAQLLWWEYEELLDHFHNRKDLWSSPSDNMWMRCLSRDEDVTVLGVGVSPPTKTGPFRVYILRTINLAWTAEQTDSYFEHLISRWTSYGQRRRSEDFLIAEAGIDPQKARAIAIGLAGIEQNGEPDPDACPIPTARELWPDVEGPELHMQFHERVCRSYGITGGGWLTVRLQGGMLRVRASLRSDGKYGGGYSGAFEGFIRPANGNVRLAAAFLYGTTIDSTGRETNFADSGQGILPEHFNYHSAVTPNLRGGAPASLTPEEYARATNLLDAPRPGNGNPANSSGAEDLPKPEPGSDV